MQSVRNSGLFLWLKLKKWVCCREQRLRSSLIYWKNQQPGRYSSGQRGQTVNLLTMSSQVRILFSPQTFVEEKCLRAIALKDFSKQKFEYRFSGAGSATQGANPKKSSFVEEKCLRASALKDFSKQKFEHRFAGAGSATQGANPT